MLLRYDLQFFADDKTEEATGKKLQDTRNKGQVGKSQEFAYGLELIALFVLLRIAIGFVAEHFIGIFKWVYGSLILDYVNTMRQGPTSVAVSSLQTGIIRQLLIILAPFFAVGFVVALFSTGLQFKFKVTFEPLKPKFDKFNPLNGLKRIFSFQSIFNLGLAIAKIGLISIIAYTTLKDHLTDLFLLYTLELNQAIALTGDLILTTGLRISLVYMVIGVADLIYQKWKFKKDQKMTKQEVKDEYKDAEGDPQIKGQIKQRMREASQRRMMQDVPQADVVITNPTTLAVAIKYDSEEAAAPIVIAKGERYVAQRIKDIARDNDITVVENKPLARIIYSTVDLGEQIPPELYQAVAEILAMVFNARGYVRR